MGVGVEGGAEGRVTPSRWVHLFTALATAVVFLAVALIWPCLVSDPIQAFGTVGLFLTFYGIVFSVIEVLRVQAATLLAKSAAQDAAHLARTAFDMRDVSECMTTIEVALAGLQRGFAPRSQPLHRILKLYTATFEDRYQDDQSVERRRIGILHTYVAAREMKKSDSLLETTLSQMLTDLAARGGQITVKVNQP